MNNRACCWILAILGVGFLLFVGLIVVGIMGVSALLTSGADRHPQIEQGTFLTVNLSGPIDETRSRPPFSRLVSGGTPTMTDVLVALRRAAKNKQIAGLILRPSGARGFAELREIREAVQDFKKSGKPVYAYLEVATDRDYYLASVADSIVIFPARSGGLFLEGIGTSSTYLAKTFEKFGIKFHVLHAGAYKGAYENLARENMTPELRESLEYLFFDVFETYVRETDSTRAKLAGHVFRDQIMNGTDLMISGEQAVKIGLADGQDDWLDFTDGLAPDGDFKDISVGDFVAATHSPHSGKHVAVVYAEGEISYTLDGDELVREEGVNSDEMIQTLRDLRDDDDVQAVVLRVNSPGGSALASELILREVLRLKEEKPVVVSMGRVAASGGYYIACGADWIVAHPNTVTGSIGVVSALPTAEGLFDKAGINVEVIKKGKWAEFIRLDQTFTAEQEAVLMKLMTGIYDDFKQRVIAARKLPADEVEAVAQGRVWTGTQALNRKLVDELGGIPTAVDKAAELAEIDSSDLRVKYYTGREDLLSFVMHRLNLSVRLLLHEHFGLLAMPATRNTLEQIDAFMERREFAQLWCPVAVNF